MGNLLMRMVLDMQNDPKGWLDRFKHAGTLAAAYRDKVLAAGGTIVDHARLVVGGNTVVIDRDGGIIRNDGGGRNHG